MAITASLDGAMRVVCVCRLILHSIAPSDPLQTRGGTADPTWDRDWPRLDDWKRWLTVAGSGHFSFTDFPVLAGELGITDPTAPLPGGHSSRITRDYVAAFFDLHLKADPQRLLDGPTPGNPEVSFQQP